MKPVKENYIKYNNLVFEGFNLNKVLEAKGEANGFILLSVFQKKFSVDINLKRHEDMKNWLRSKGYKYVVLDGIQIVYDEVDKKNYEYSMLYFLIFLNEVMESDEDIPSLIQVLIKRYDLSQIILKDPFSETIESWNRDLIRKSFRNIEELGSHSIIEKFFQGINKKNKFYFVGIEKPSEPIAVKKSYPNMLKFNKDNLLNKKAIA